MKTSITLKLKNNLAFEAEVNHHQIIIDTEDNNLGPSPKKLLMVSLGGCTGMDVISIIRKMKVEFTKFYLDVTGDIQDEHPKKYLKIELNYCIDAKESDKEKIEKAINLSKDKYCGVWNTLAPALDIDYKITFIKNNQ